MEEKKETVQVNKFVNELCDSVEIGTPSKGGAVKIYFNSDNVEEAKKKVERAFEVRKKAQEELEKQQE